MGFDNHLEVCLVNLLVQTWPYPDGKFDSDNLAYLSILPLWYWQIKEENMVIEVSPPLPDSPLKP